MHEKSGVRFRDIKSTLHQIYISGIIIKGQENITRLLDRLCLHQSRKEPNREESLLIQKGSLKKVEEPPKCHCRKVNQIKKCEHLVSNGFKEGKIDDFSSVSGNFNSFSALKETEYQSRVVDRALNCSKYNWERDIDAFKDSAEVDCRTAMRQKKDLSICETSSTELEGIASVCTNNEEEIMAEIQAFEEMLERNLREAEKCLHEQLMIKIGYRYLIQSVSLKIIETEKELKQEKERGRRLQKICQKRKLKSVKVGDEDTESYMVKEQACKERNEFMELLRIKESILMADCIISAQKDEIVASEKLIKEFDFCISKKTEELNKLEKQIYSRKSYDLARPHYCNRNLKNIWLEGCGKDKNVYEKSFFKELQIFSANGFGGEEHCPMLCGSDSNDYKDFARVSRCFRCSDCGKIGVYCNKNGVNDCTDKLQPSNEVCDCLYELKSEGTSFGLKAELNSFHTSILSQHYLDHECDSWFYRLQVASRMLQIPSETRLEPMNEANNAPRALGRSRRSSIKQLPRDTIYRTNAIAV
eukprot:gene11369-21564_t